MNRQFCTWFLLIVSEALLLVSISDAAESASSPEKRRTDIVVLTRLNSDGTSGFSTDALKVMCDELTVTGFNVIREEHSSDAGESLPRVVSDVLYAHQSFVVVVVSPAGASGGTVTLLGRKGLDEVVEFDSIPVTFPISRNHAELVAFKVSEKAALLSDGMKYSPPPVPVDEAVNPATDTASAPGEAPEAAADGARKKTDERSDWEGSKLGVFAHGSTAWSPGENAIGWMGGLGGGLRWRPMVHMMLDAEVTFYPWSRAVTEESIGEASMQLLLARAGIGYVFRLSGIVLAHLGLAVGIGNLRIIGNAFAENTVAHTFNETKGYGGILGGCAFRLHRRIAIPLRISVGAIWPEEKISVGTKTTDNTISKATAHFGPWMAEVSIGFLVLLQ